MKDNQPHLQDSADLRRRAEEMVREKDDQSPQDLASLSPDEIQRMFHELRVHQIELEMQNEEMQRSHFEVKTARERYFSLYDMAPVGYVTLNEKGLILEANLAAAGLLGVPRNALVKQLFARFIVPEDQNSYYLHYRQLLKTGEPQIYELRLLKPASRVTNGKILNGCQGKDETLLWAQLTATAVKDSAGASVCRIVLSDITERKQRENESRAIATLSTVLRTAWARAEILPIIAEQLASMLQCNAISAEMIDPLVNDTIVEAAYGVWKPLIGYRQPANTRLIALILETRRAYCNCKNDFDDISRLISPGFFSGGIHCIIGSPLIAQDQLIGILWIGRDKEISESEVRLLEAISDIAANSIHRATLLEQTRKYALDLAHAYDTTLEGWAHALELRDQETIGHSRSVVRLTVDLARAMGFDEGELNHIRRGALLHDIGKMGIPDSVLLKPGPLDECEREIMRRHPEYAHLLLEPIEYLRPAIDIPYCHHEKWDGSGYPRGLKGEDIPLIARVFAIVDVWDALQSDRPYRKALTTEQACSYILEQSGYHFDPLVVQSFLKIIDQAAKQE